MERTRKATRMVTKIANNILNFNWIVAKLVLLYNLREITSENLCKAVTNFEIVEGIHSVR